MYLNAKTESTYSVKNSELLSKSANANGFDSLEVAGYKQWAELGRQVKKGEKATKIFMMVDRKTTKKKDAVKEKVIKTRSVFFKDQTEEAA